MKILLRENGSKNKWSRLINDISKMKVFSMKNSKIKKRKRETFSNAGYQRCKTCVIIEQESKIEYGAGEGTYLP